MKKKQLRKEKITNESTYIVPHLNLEKSKKSYYNVPGLMIIILLGIVIYSNSFSCSFHFDDFPNIVDKTFPPLTDFNSWWKLSQSRLVAYYSFALNIHFNGMNVWGFHLVNLTIHLINSCLVWWLTFLIFSTAIIRDHPIAKYKNELAFITALMFVSHPLATQSVTYIVQRMASLVALFYLLSIALYLKARLINNLSVAKYFMFAGSFLSSGLAIFTKENAFTLPFAIVLVELFFIRKEKLNVNLKNYRQLIAIMGLIGFIFIIAFKFSFKIFKSIPPNEVHAEILTPITYLFTSFKVIVKYIQILILPINQVLDYDIPISTSLFEIKTLLSFLFVFSSITLASRLFKKYRIFSFGIFWFFLTLMIETSIIPINDVIFEHRTYLPSFGFFLILSYGIYFLLRKKNKLLAFVICTCIIGMNSFLTFERNKVWKDELSLWSDNVGKAPNIARPIHNRGFAYWNLGQWEKALADYSIALRNYPRYPQALSNRGVVYGHFKQWEKAIIDYSKAIEIDPNLVSAFSNRGTAYEELKQWEKAIADYTKAIELNPNYPKAYSNRGVIFEKLKLWDKAIKDYSEAIKLDPNFKLAYYNRGVAFENLKQWDKAIEDYSKMIEFDPKYKQAYIRKGYTYGEQGKWEKAIEEYNKVIEIDPSFSIAFTFRDEAYKHLTSIIVNNGDIQIQLEAK